MDLKDIEKITGLYSDPALVVDGQCRLLFYNEVARDRLVLPGAAARQDLTLFDCVSESREEIEDFIRACMRTNESSRARFTPKNKTESNGPAICIGIVIKRASDPSQSWVLIRCTGVDTLNTNFPVLSRTVEELSREIAHRRQIEERLSVSLAEKEVLLKETHHRVKNNLQIISSLLNLQSAQIEDEKIRDLFTESKNRVSTMALIHEKLYRSGDLVQVDFADYLESLVDVASETYSLLGDRVKIELSNKDVYLNIDTAIPCALIVNELLSNALKYAFVDENTSGRGAQKIRVEMIRDGDEGYVLTVSDNGCGFAQDIDFRNTESLGLQIVNTLTEQLGGTIELDNERGATFEIRFEEVDRVTGSKRMKQHLT